MKRWSTVIAIAVLLVFSAVTGDAAGRRARQPAKPQTIEIHARKFGFEPSELTLRKGQAYNLHLTSDDVPHSLRIEALEVNSEMKPGEFSELLLTAEKAGDYRANCGLYCGPGHGGMSLIVHVVDN